MKNKKIRLAAVLCTSVILTACGGGSGGDASPTPSNPSMPTNPPVPENPGVNPPTTSPIEPPVVSPPLPPASSPPANPPIVNPPNPPVVSPPIVVPPVEPPVSPPVPPVEPVVDPTPVTLGTSQKVRMSIIADHSSFTLKAPARVTYGSGKLNYEKLLQPGTYACGDEVFGNPDYAGHKMCWVLYEGTANAIANNNSTFTLTEKSTVAYGDLGQYREIEDMPAGNYSCNTALFGALPAAAGGDVKCYVKPNPNVAENIIHGPNDHDVTTNGVVDQSKWLATAALIGTDAGIAYKYGPSASYYGTQSNTGRPVYKSRKNGTFYMDTNNPSGPPFWPGCNDTNFCGKWQFGGPVVYEHGDYSSSGTQVAYIPDSIIGYDKSFFPKEYLGLGTYNSAAVAHDVAAYNLEKSWILNSGVMNNGGENDSNLESYTLKGVNPPRPWVQTISDLDKKPVVSTHCYGRGGWCTNTMTVWKNGWITFHGSNTNHNELTGRLPAGKVPTSATITNSGEFALVTVWDTTAFKAQIAVIALADGCQWCNPNDESGWDRNWGNARQVYHGLPGLGNYVAMKIVGYVDLPNNMKAPTEIWATTGKHQYDYNATSLFWDEPFNVENNRKRFFGTPLSNTPQGIEDAQARGNAIARTGMIAVISKSEKRAAFYDLRPLLQYYRQQYFGSTQSEFNSMIANRGNGDNQWPYTFNSVPSQTPTLIKTVDLPATPTAIKLSLNAPHRAFIATQEGKLRVYNLGNRYLDQQAATVGQPSDIVEQFTVDVGRNVTDITFPKEHGWGGWFQAGPYNRNGATEAKPENFLIVNSRGDRKIQWIDFGSAWNTGTITQTLSDARIVDPIGIEDTNNHGTEAYAMVVADYGGRRVHSFMYGKVITHTYSNHKCSEANGGCSLVDNAEFEYINSQALPGKPFNVKTENIN